MYNIDEVKNINKMFVVEKKYTEHETDCLPNKNLAIITCMDSRLTQLTLSALGLKNGDAKIIKSAGAMITSELDNVIRSLIVGIYRLGVKEVMVIGHDDCGMTNLDGLNLVEDILKYNNLNLDENDKEMYSKWLDGFEDVSDSVNETIKSIEEHVLIPKDLYIKGFVINPRTGELREVSPKN